MAIRFHDYRVAARLKSVHMALPAREIPFHCRPGLCQFWVYPNRTARSWRKTVRLGSIPYFLTRCVGSSKRLIGQMPPVGQIVGYRRVSTDDQNAARQLEGTALHEAFEDKASGKDASRPQLQAMLKYVRRGDTIVCHSMDRMARNLDDLRRLVTALTGRGVRVQFLKENLTFTVTIRRCRTCC